MPVTVIEVLGIIMIVILYSAFAVVISEFLKDIFANQKKGK